MSQKAAIPAVLIALTLAACGMAGAATIQAGAPLRPEAMPISCRLVLSERGDQVTVEGRVSAMTPREGSYSLRVLQRSAGGSAQISQGGSFVARPGEELILGSAQFAGPARDLVAALSVEENGRSVDCPASTR